MASKATPANEAKRVYAEKSGIMVPVFGRGNWVGSSFTELAFRARDSFEKITFLFKIINKNVIFMSEQ
jgi:hypothetical protein